MKIKDLNKFKLSEKPGVYLFKKDNNVIYIGKATSLKDRVRSYFLSDLINTRGSRIIDMVTIANSLDFKITDNVLEALILESNLIKQFKPKYNILEKDDKSFNYIVITNEDFPKIYIERGRNIEMHEKKSEFQYIFGPYPHGGQLKEALKIIRKIFPYRTGNEASDLYKQIGLEPDLSKNDAKKEYAKTIKNIIRFLKGNTKDLQKSLEKEMIAFAKNKEFEKANIVKKQLFSLQHIRDVSLIKSDKNDDIKAYRIESYDIAHQSGQNSVGVFTVIENGEVKKPDYRKFILRETKKGDDVGGLKEVLNRRLKHPEWPIPDIFVVDGGRGQYNQLEKIIKPLGIHSEIVAVTKDDKHRPISLIGDEEIIKKHKKEILLSNNEAHRFAIAFFRKKQRSTFKNPQP